VSPECGWKREREADTKERKKTFPKKGEVMASLARLPLVGVEPASKVGAFWPTPLTEGGLLMEGAKLL
jgi:hypothetical protein